MNPIKDMKGKLLESYGRVKIFEGFPHNFYDLSPSPLPDADKRIADTIINVMMGKEPMQQLGKFVTSPQALDDFSKRVIQTIEINELTRKLPKPKQAEELMAGLSEMAKKIKVSNQSQLAEYILDYSVGYRVFSTMMRDSSLEEIMVNGFDRNIFVFHKKYGMCKTNLIVKEDEFILELINRIAHSVNKQFNEVHPLLDARLPDGSRANATFSYVTPFGHSLTIRKFSKIPISIVQMVESGNLTEELAAFLWLMVEGLGINPMNIIITGGSGSGKTTMMNVLSSFIPYSSRVISIEDTPELDLGSRSNWIQMESKPKIKDISEVTMDDLLKNSLRMRPDRILVGEVRGEEAQTLFVAMDTGHSGILGTLHSNTAREMMLRLRSAPMSVPDSMLPLLDLAIVMQRAYSKERGISRIIKQVAEIGRMDEKVLLSNVYEFNPKRQRVEKTDVPARVTELLAESAGMTKNELKGEMLVRQRILEWMIAKGIRERDRVEQVIQQYYFDPHSVLKRITESEPS